MICNFYLQFKTKYHFYYFKIKMLAWEPKNCFQNTSVYWH